MKLTKNLVSREEAVRINSDYVKYVEGDFDKFEVVESAFNKLKRGHRALTYVREIGFVVVKVTSINYNDYRAVDGPVVRVGNDDGYSWRVDGDGYAVPF
jgi:hypothetical protein